MMGKEGIRMENLKARARKINTMLPAVFLALRDPKTPRTARILAALTVGYALSPIDLIPDFIPVLGYLDDVLLLPLLITLTIRLIPEDVWERCQKEAVGLWENGRPKRWYYALPIVGFWLIILFFILRLLFLR